MLGASARFIIANCLSALRLHRRDWRTRLLDLALDPTHGNRRDKGDATPMRRLSLYALLSANSISLIGNQFTIVALPWFVLQTTGSAAKTGLTGFSVALPYFLVGIFGGALIDRFGYRGISVTSDIVSGCAIATVPLLYHTVGLAFWELMVLVFFSSFLSIPGLSARRSMLPEIAEASGLRLDRVNTAFEGIYPVSAFLGPPLAGLMIVWMSAGTVLWIDAATFALSALLVFAGVQRTRRLHQAVARPRYIDDLREGIDFLRRERVLLYMALTLAVSNLLMGPLFGVVLPIYARDVFHSAKDLGFMLSAFGAGQVIGTVVYGTVGNRLPRRFIWLLGFVGVTIPFFALLWWPGLFVMVAAMGVAAVTDGPLSPMSVTIRHERIPAQLRGRIFSTFSAVGTAAIPVGLAAIGFLIDAIGLHRSVWILAILSAALALAVIAMPVFREMDAVGIPVRAAADPDAAPD